MSPQNSMMSAMHGLDLGSPEEKEAFHFFEHHSNTELAGFFDASFWQFEILQASHTLPAVRHAVLALSAMHHKFIVGRMPVVPEDIDDRQLRFALQHTNRAIQEIVKSPVRKTVADSINMMTSCILFYCLECLQGHQKTALGHLRSGLNILRELDEDIAAGLEDPRDHPILLSSLRAMFVNMDSKARGIMGEEMLSSWVRHPKRDFKARPTAFKTFAQARYYFEATYNDLLAVLQGLDVTPPTTEEGFAAVKSEYRRFERDFREGSERLDQFTSQLSPQLSQGDQQVILGIRLLQSQIRVYLRVYRQFNKGMGIRAIDWHVEEHEMAGMMDLASQLLGAPPDLAVPAGAKPEDYYPSPADRARSAAAEAAAAAAEIPSHSRPIFSMGSGLLSALWMVTSRAKSSALRRRAIAMLLDYPRREGIWDSVLAGRIAWEVLVLEETAEDGVPGMHKDQTTRNAEAPLPNGNEMQAVDINYTGNREALVEFRTMKHVEAGEPNLDFDARVPIPFSVFPSSYRSDAVTKESTKVQVEGEQQLPAQASHVGREGHEEHHSSFSATVHHQPPPPPPPPSQGRDTYVKEEVHIHEEDRIRRPPPPPLAPSSHHPSHAPHGREEIHIHEETRYRLPEQQHARSHVHSHAQHHQHEHQHEHEHQHLQQPPPPPQPSSQPPQFRERIDVDIHSREARDSRYQQDYRPYTGGQSQVHVTDRSYDREFNTVHGPATDYAPTQIDVSERQFREHTRPIVGGYVAADHTSYDTQPNREQASGYVKETYTARDSRPHQRRDLDAVDSRYPVREQVRVEETTRATADTPKRYKRDMGYYDEDGHYHSFRQGLNKAAHKVAERIAHPIHGDRHHHSHHHSHTGSTYDDRREEVIVKEKYTTTAPAPPAPSVRPVSSGAPVERVRVVASGPAPPAPAPATFAPSAPLPPVTTHFHSHHTTARTMSPPNTITIPCHHIRIGDLLILQGRPCQVIRITTSSQTGQHRYLGVDLFTKQLHEESSFISNPAPSVVVQNMLGPVFKQYRVLDIREDGKVVAMTETGDVKQGLPILDQSGLLTRLTESFDNGRGSVRILVINDEGMEMAVDYKVVHGSRL
ncbi:hypothetical protein BS50DRAFT_640402 [Corynespora cassiicola Philippines]|uniref:Translation initiation factor 5A-like N-terminal domain-containing protein n=1 Tax=Corynespora cassiicola Philippines TaxID=1448308 RepID=A0A2T2N3G4_CORCC|nr:hypothetical protein BS50DRAFT_640402 [Corynespora cassiicola Philippines]